ncbi:hypothetical protein COO60DRAFT_1133701 [Scenedesmus sp. NREL 46B-D3]|nr:hypothetical protein COO60DRAFT_1133701 [Scenedesmus sp. NREL 46B-D3]
MAPKKSKGSSSSATPIPDEARARAVYKQLSEKKKWIEAVKSAQSSDFIHCLARTRVLLDKQPEKDSKEKAAFLKVALEVYTKLPAGCEQPPGQQLSSLGMLAARAKLLQLLSEEQQLRAEQQVDGLAYLAQQISKGFTRDDWHKVWFDPRSEQLKEEDKARGNMVAAAAAAAEQLTDATQAYAIVYLKHVLPATTEDEGLKAALAKVPNIKELKQPWITEVNSAKTAGAAAKAAEPSNKQQDPKKALQRESKQQEQLLLQQRDPRRAGGRDTDRVRDIKRSKAAQEDKQHQLELEAARKKEEEAKEDAAKVLDYLEKRLLSGSSSSSPEQHMARLQEESRVSLEVLKKTISSLGNRDAKDKDKQELPQELLWCRQQLDSTNPSDHVLKQQLQQLQEKGPSAWLVFHDDTAAGKTGGGGETHKALYDSWQEFEEHVVATHLVTAPQGMPLAFADEATEELVSDAYKLKGLMQPPLADAAAAATRHGSLDSDSPWLKAFEMECPLQRFTRTMLLLNVEDNVAASTGVQEEQFVRQNTALGFALLQAERKQVAVDRLQQSRSPAWALLAYHSLRLLSAVNGEVDADRDHFVIYNYWHSKQVSRVRQPCIAAQCVYV